VLSKVAIIGSRGIPAKYGGFETFVEEVSTRLISHGHVIYVSCEGGNSPKMPDYKGVKLFYFPLKPFYRVVYETMYDVYSMIKSCTLCDSIYILGYGAGFFFFIPKIFGKRLIINVDGIEWRRNKYNRLEKMILYFSEILAVKFADVVVADAQAIKKYIELSYKKDALFIPYGAEPPQKERWDSLKFDGIPGGERLKNIKPNDYYLVVARLEPENSIYEIIEGYLLSRVNKKLVIVGNFLNHKYEKKVHDIIRMHGAEDRVIFTGGIYINRLLNMLRQNCYVYIHGHSAGGTNPSLLEAMIMENIIIAHDNEFNREVGGVSILYFKGSKDLADKLAKIDNKIDDYVKLKNTASRRVKDEYSWEKIAMCYNELFKNN
jgi:glycosyltransferase involved in cell wall biosynthesis